ncbi:MAG: hypothetical protein U1C57_03345 [Candidatus Doudnabacteria bacterium]|nr:beta-galactosidase [bacterium]MDZ4244112.1 hypothetical protein [Candidatus Doudnabacteria bacterium]
MFRRIYKFIKWTLIIAAALAGFFYFRFEPADNIVWGVNFSIPQASYMGFDWKKMYLDVLDDLKPERLRVMAYWEILEPERGKYEFDDIDFLLAEAGKRGAKTVLVLGHKQPRWPECHHPDWYNSLSDEEKDEALLAMLSASVEHFREYDSISAWQIENETLFPYGFDCGVVKWGVFRKELSVVKTLDSRPILVTDSGEKGAWLPATWAGGDIFGSTMYREVYHDAKQKYIKYPIPAFVYRIKAGMVETLSGIDKVWGVELQAEPWFESDVHETPWERQTELMNPEIFAANVEYAKSVGFEENYFWGVEWWYWAREHGHPEMWEAAKKLMSEQ